MKKRLMIWVLVLTLCLTAAAPALAANVFAFTEKVIDVFEGETVQTALRREGNYDGDGEIAYASSNAAVATVSQDGAVTAVGKGKTQISAVLTRNGKQAGKALVSVNVLRAVSKVTLNTTKLSVYDPYDPAVAGLLKEPAEHQVLVLPAGATAALAATCTPMDASNLKVTFTSSDAGVARIAGTSLKAIQRGECDLVVASVQNPDVTETLRVLVIQPVKTIQIDAGQKKVPAGASLQLSATCQPDNASIPVVTWSSKTPQIAVVDENGLVTGLKKGNASIAATAADGSGVSQTVILSVTQPVTGLSFPQADVQVIAGRTATARVNVEPADATDKTVSWSTSDETIATVRGNGQVTGVRAGECLLIATSNSNQTVTATTRIVVSQLVTKIENANDASELTIRVGESFQTRWDILPADATVTALTFRSNSPKVATVDENGLVTGAGRGVVSIVATSKDTGKKQGTVKVTVIQPVTGVSIQRSRYYIQHGRGGTIRAVIQPKNANNQKVYWASGDENIASIVSNGTNTGKITGITNGTTQIYTTTEDGGFTASSEVRVGYWNNVVAIEDLWVDSSNSIKIVLRNVSNDITMKKIRFFVECYDTDGNPFICNTDGESTYFEGSYNHLLAPYERTIHGTFNFGNFLIDRPLGAVVLKVVSWTDDDGIQYTVPAGEEQYKAWPQWTYHNENNYQGDGVG